MIRNLDPFYGFDMIKVAQWQYGPKATVWEFPAHAYGWAGKLPGDSRRLPLDLHGYIQAKYGSSARAVLTGMSGADWAWYRPHDTDWAVQPVIMVASDQISNPAKVRAAVDTFHHNVKTVSEWYDTQLPNGFQVIKPIVIHSHRSTADWKKIYDDTEDRFDLWKICAEDIKQAMGHVVNPDVIHAVTQFCGDTPAWDFDAAGGAFSLISGYGWLAVTSSFACCHRFDPNSISDWDNIVAYALAHEIGHCLELGHTDAKNGDATGIEKAVMQRGYPLWAVLVPYEKQKILANSRTKRFVTWV